MMDGKANRRQEEKNVFLMGVGVKKIKLAARRDQEYRMVTEQGGREKGTRSRKRSRTCIWYMIEEIFEAWVAMDDGWVGPGLC